MSRGHGTKAERVGPRGVGRVRYLAFYLSAFISSVIWLLFTAALLLVPFPRVFELILISIMVPGLVVSLVIGIWGLGSGTTDALVLRLPFGAVLGAILSFELLACFYMIWIVATPP